MLGDTAYDTKRFSKQPNKQKSYSFLPSTSAIAGNGKMPMAGFFLFFCKRRLANGCLDFAAEWNGYLNELKSDGVEPPRWYGFHRICTACVVLHLYA